MDVLIAACARGKQFLPSDLKAPLLCTATSERKLQRRSQQQDE